MDGAPPPEEDFSVLPVADRLAHKNWKARVSGYESLIKTFQNTASDTDPAFRPYVSNPDLVKKLVADANAVAQEKGVECVVALVKFAGETAARTREAVIPALVDKCLGSTRAGTKNQALELILQYVEVENGGAGVVVSSFSCLELDPGGVLTSPYLTDRPPSRSSGKAAQSGGRMCHSSERSGSVCVLVGLWSLVRTDTAPPNSNFGIQVVPPPPVLKALPKIFSHTDKNVRAEGTALALNLYQYLGTGIESWLADLKPVQVKELKEAFEGLDKDGKGKGSVKPERLTRAAAREAESQAEAGGGDDGGAEEGAAAGMSIATSAASLKGLTLSRTRGI